MFEKEAEEQAKKKYPIPFNWDSIDLARNTKYEEGFQDGAEFGYNKGYHDAEEHYMNVIDSQHKLVEESKVNEWHYPLKGEYPKEYKDILICFLTEDDMKDCVRGWYEYDLYEDEHYFKTVNTFGTAVIKNVIAWKEIVLPKESE